MMGPTAIKQSLEEQLSEIEVAFQAQYGSQPQRENDFYVYVLETQEDYVIASVGDSYYQIPFSKSGNDITFGSRDEWKEVKRTTTWEAKRMKRRSVLKFIKADGNELHLDGYLALWGGKDFDGEHFSQETDFESSYTKTGRLLVDWEHGLEPDVDDEGKAIKQPGRDDVLGYVDWLTARKDDMGLLARHILDRREKYVSELVEPLARANLLGTSTEAVVSKSQVEADGAIMRWPLKRQSLTVMPAESRLMTEQQLSIIKSLAEQYPNLKALVPEAAGTAATNSATAEGGAKPPKQTGSNPGKENKMTEINEEMVAKIAADAAAEAVKAEREARAAEEKERVEQETHDKKVAEEAIKAFQKEQPATDQFGTVVNVAKHSDVWKYDNYPAADLAAVAEIVGSATGRKSAEKATSAQQRPLLTKALALRLESDEANDESEQTMAAGRKIVMPGPLKMAARAMKMAGVKADEYDSSVNPSYGDEWIGVAYGGQLWEAVRESAPIVDKVPQFEFPAGAESMVIPVESTDPIWYLVAQADPDPGATTRVTLTVPAKAMGTAQKSMTLGKIGSATGYTGEMVEDSVLPFVNQLRVQIGLSGGEYLVHCLIDGDVATGSTTNINKIEGSPAGNEAYLVFDGFRNLALVENTANSRDGGVISTSDFLETVKLMGAAGKDGFDRRRVSFIIDPPTHWKCLELADVKTKDVFSAATLEGGQLVRVYGYEVIPSYQMHFASVANTGYEYKTEATGKIDLTTASDNTKGAILAVRWDHWRLGFRRRVTTEVERIPRADSWEITSILRAGFQRRDDEAASISYNLTV